MSAFFLNSHMNLFFINLCSISIPVNLSLVFSYFLIHVSVLLVSYCFLKRVKNMLVRGSWVFRLGTLSHFLFSQCVMMVRYRGQWDFLHCECPVWGSPVLCPAGQCSSPGVGLPRAGDSVGWVQLLLVGYDCSKAWFLCTSFSWKTKNMSELLFPFSLWSCDVLEVFWKYEFIWTFLLFSFGSRWIHPLHPPSFTHLSSPAC